MTPPATPNRVMGRALILGGVWIVVAVVGMMVAGPHAGVWFFGGIGLGWLGAVIAVAAIESDKVTRS